MGLDQEGLRLKIRYAADAQISLHLPHIPVKFGPEGGIFDIVDRTVETVLTIRRHTAPPRPQMGMIVNTVKKFKYAVSFCCYTKKSTHRCSLSKSYDPLLLYVKVYIIS